MQANDLISFYKYIKIELCHLYTASEIQQLYFILAGHVVNKTKTELIACENNYKLTDKQLLKLTAYTQRLKKGEPYQYVIEKAWFMDLELKVKKGVLIPRPETEELCHWIIQSIDYNPTAILDIGTGSGCIAIAIKKHFYHSRVYATDFSDKALKTAIANSKKYKLDIRFMQHDIFKHFQLNQMFDVIVSNPPYVTEKEKQNMNRRVYGYEPSEALFVPDNDPLRFYRQICSFAKKYLIKNGWIYFEINELYGVEMMELLQEFGFYHIEIKNDINSKPRMIRGKK